MTSSAPTTTAAAESAAAPPTQLLPSAGRLQGKVALITGGATGIGEAIATLFHSHGAKLCIFDIQEEPGRRLCAHLGGDAHAIFVHGDVTSEDDVRGAVDRVVSAFGTLDVLVNNAGVSGKPAGDIRDLDMAEFRALMDINLLGGVHGVKHAARAMIPRGRGSIVSIGSVTCTTGGMGPHGYTSSKHALLGFTRSAAAELGKHGVRVNLVSPYAIPTGLAFAHLPPEERTEDLVRSFLEFVGGAANLKGVDLMPKDVAEAVLFLASDESRYVSGLNLAVDGGLTCVNHDLRVFR